MQVISSGVFKPTAVELGVCPPTPVFGEIILNTLEYQINVQEVINMQAGKISKINKRAGGNKAVQAGIFQKSIVKNHKKVEKFQKSINVQEVIRLCR